MAFPIYQNIYDVIENNINQYYFFLEIFAITWFPIQDRDRLGIKFQDWRMHLRQLVRTSGPIFE